MTIDMSWMAWTWQTAVFFAAIALLLLAMSLFAILHPAAPRKGVLGIETTPGDRLFVSLLGSAYVCLGYLYFFGSPIWWALVVCAAFTVAVFRWV